MAADDESPLIKALPPESDYLTYLTIVEYNLTPESLPILHKVLQDETLNINIGWDLVHLLLPLLPDSEQCLQDIARLGNPREVILKVTESLQLLQHESAEPDASEEVFGTAPQTDDARARAESSTYPVKTAATDEGSSRPGSSQMVERPPPPPLAVSQFIALMWMLAILHPRIKTKRPSRFLSTTLQAILGSLTSVETNQEQMILAVVKTVKAISGIQRPTLPSRKSSGMLSSVPTTRSEVAADPEGADSAESMPEEDAMQRKLVQSFVTHVVEEYMLSLPEVSDVPGMAWCSRIMEKMHPGRIIPDTKTFAERFGREESLHKRIDALGQLVALAQDLRVDDHDLLAASINADDVVVLGGRDEEPPSSADDIPLSRLGSMLLYTARQAASLLYATTGAYSDAGFSIFPDHHELLKQCLSSPAQGTGALGTEPEVVIDAVLALALVCLEQDAIGMPSTDEEFNEYLQVTALLSSNCPSPNLRGHAHYVTSTILRSQPDDSVRLSFIRDTLEHCPFDNLKVSAVGWIKGETIEANPAQSTHQHDTGTAGTSSVFAKPLALDSLAPFLFPSLHADLVTAPLLDSWTVFQTNLSFYLTSLNFLYLLLCAKHLHDNLAIADLWTTADVAGSFLQPLRDASTRFNRELDEGGALADERTSGVVAELLLLDETVARVTSAVRLLNE